MAVPRTVIRLALAATLAALVGLIAPPAAAAPGPGMSLDIPLRPLGEAPVAELLAYRCTAAVVCEGASCAVHTTQRYQVALLPDVAGTTLRLGLPSGVHDHPTAPLDIALLDEQGTPLAAVAVSPDAGLHAAWEMPLAPGERRTLILTYRHPAAEDPFTIWSWEGGALPAWGTVSAAHVEFVLPQATGDDALVRVAPHRANLDGPRLWWDYEQVGDYAAHYVVAVSPPAWQRLQAWRAQGAHREVAAMLRRLHEAAAEEGVPGVDYMPEVIAELIAATTADPTDTDAHSDLAAVYRARAEELPERRLNYVLLAARALEDARTRAADTSEAERFAEALGRTYLVAAETASAQGDPAGALGYLKLARTAAGELLGGELAQSDELTLRWAVTLAEQGRVTEALDALAGALTPALEDTLLRYAPPLTGARTVVTITPASRRAHYTLDAYPLAVDRVRAQLDEVVTRLGALACCRATLEQQGTALLLTIEVPAATAADMAACQPAILEALSADTELVTALIALPWQAAPGELTWESELWRDRLRFGERIDATPLQELWQSASEYAAWRLVELNNALPGDTRAELERALALAVMREQRQMWEMLPLATHWVYRVARAEGAPPDGEWLVAWGHDRQLALDTSLPRWDAIRTACLAAAGLLAMLLVLSHAWRVLARKSE